MYNPDLELPLSGTLIVKGTGLISVNVLCALMSVVVVLKMCRL